MRHHLNSSSPITALPLHQDKPERLQKPFCPGFSLVELLIVMAIITILVFVASSAIRSASPSGVDAGLVQVTDLLELSRNKAITDKTYVWISFQTITSTMGTPQLQMGAVYSLDGSGNNTAQGNLGVLSRVRTVPQLTLVRWTGLKTTTQNLFKPTAVTSPISVSTTPVSIGNNTIGIPCTIGNTSFPGTTTVTFTPRGQAMRRGSVNAGAADTFGYDNYIDISFKQTKGTSATVSEDAAVVIDGSSGALTLVRHT